VEVSCWAGSQCVAIDADGYVFWTESPYGGAWVRSRHSIDTAAQITGLSCGDEGWCVAVDACGSVLTQSQTSPIGAWHTTSYVVNGQPGSYDNLAAVSCTPAVCVAANAHGWLWTNKATQGGAWTSFGGIRTAYDISSVSCLTGGSCVVTGPHETTTDPALDPFGGASAWSVHWNSDPATYPQPTAVSCAAATLCVGVNDAPWAPASRSCPRHRASPDRSPAPRRAIRRSTRPARARCTPSPAPPAPASSPARNSARSATTPAT
jgi:hypothetical protein